MKHQEEQTCIYCCYYKQTRIDHGQCRINPPSGVGEKYVGKWPEVADGYWCGQFKSAGEKGEKIQAQASIPRPARRPSGAVPTQAKPQMSSSIKIPKPGIGSNQ